MTCDQRFDGNDDETMTVYPADSLINVQISCDLQQRIRTLCELTLRFGLGNRSAGDLQFLTANILCNIYGHRFAGHLIIWAVVLQTPGLPSRRRSKIVTDSVRGDSMNVTYRFVRILNFLLSSLSKRPRLRGAALAFAILLMSAVSTAPSAQAQNEVVLYSFTGASGSNVVAGLIRDANGNLYGTADNGGDGGCNCGTVFKLDTMGNETVLYSFTDTNGDGANPIAGLVMDANGNLYGTTTNGGANELGIVFKVDTSGHETVLYTFGMTAQDGANPRSSLIMDGNGNLYGTTYNGGANGLGTVFKLDTSGNLTVLYSFQGSAGDGSNPQAGLIMDTNGNFYGTTSGGGSGNGGTVFKLDTTGTETVLHIFTGGTGDGDGESPVAGLIMDANGNLYGTTQNGGGHLGMGIIFRVDSMGNETILYAFTGTNGDGATPQSGLVQDAAGNLYGTTLCGGSFTGNANCLGGSSGYGTVFELSATGQETVLYSFGPSPDAEFPVAGLVRDAGGNLYGTTAAGGTSGAGAVFELPIVFPVAKLSPTSVTFAGQDTGTTSAAKTITLTNPGSAPLSISGITVTGTDSGDFNQTNTCGTGIGVNGTCKIMVTFSPTATGLRTASVMLTDNAAGSPQSVPLKGTGILPVTLTPATLAFGNVAVGTTSTSKSVVVKNTSSTTLTITSISLTGPDPGSYNLTNPCGSSLASEKSCTLAVTFSPASSGALDASITLDDSASNSPQTVSLTGAGVAPVMVTPASLIFANQNVGTTSAAKLVMLKNNQSISLTGIGIGFSGPNAGDFSNTTTCSSMLAANKTCTISVKFAPSAAGAESATLVITDSASDSPQQVPLSGTGVISVTVTPATLTFASQTVGTTSAAKTITVKNNSTTASLTITGVALSGNDPGDFNPTNMCVSPLAPATSCTISVTFDPMATGSRTAKLTISDINGTTDQQNVSLSGTGK
jgi:uncharacterized repeat protein (TIGR03803 family)